jgi:hypothetical protein
MKGEDGSFQQELYASLSRFSYPEERGRVYGKDTKESEKPDWIF